MPPIAPIVGKLRKRLITDLSMGLGLGFAGGYLFWYSVHKPMVANRDAYYRERMFYHARDGIKLCHVLNYPSVLLRHNIDASINTSSDIPVSGINLMGLRDLLRVVLGVGKAGSVHGSKFTRDPEHSAPDERVNKGLALDESLRNELCRGDTPRDSLSALYCRFRNAVYRRHECTKLGRLHWSPWMVNKDPPGTSARSKMVLRCARRYAFFLDRLITIPVVKHPIGVGVLPDAAPLAGGPIMSAINFALLYTFFRLAGASNRLACSRLPTLALDGATSGIPLGGPIFSAILQINLRLACDVVTMALFLDALKEDNLIEIDGGYTSKQLNGYFGNNQIVLAPSIRDEIGL